MFKTLSVPDLDILEKDIAVILCELEKIIPPSFFTVMVYLVMHLASEVKIASPVQYCWMYPIKVSHIFYQEVIFYFFNCIVQFFILVFHLGTYHTFSLMCEIEFL